MENYTKGETKEVEEPPVFDLNDGSVLMRVSSGSKLRNLMGFAVVKMKQENTRQMCWNGTGNAVTKTITCAEIMKRKFKGLHQITKIRYRRVEEYWEPKLEGLERLKVNKDIPAISILLSKDPLDSSEPGYQPPGPVEEFWKDVVQNDRTRKNKAKRLRENDGDKNAQNQSTQNKTFETGKKRRNKGRGGGDSGRGESNSGRKGGGDSGRGGSNSGRGGSNSEREGGNSGRGGGDPGRGGSNSGRGGGNSGRGGGNSGRGGRDPGRGGSNSGRGGGNSGRGGGNSDIGGSDSGGKEKRGFEGQGGANFRGRGSGGFRGRGGNGGRGGSS